MIQLLKVFLENNDMSYFENGHMIVFIFNGKRYYYDDTSKMVTVDVKENTLLETINIILDHDCKE